jgi:methylamine utilization protein MauE
MDSLLLTLRLALAVVFAVAAAGKLLDRRGSRQAMADFGVPHGLTSWAATLVPLAELVVAVGLLQSLEALGMAAHHKQSVRLGLLRERSGPGEWAVHLGRQSTALSLDDRSGQRALAAALTSALRV